MAQEIFKRIEKKYMLSEKQYMALLPELGSRMSEDEYGRHTISNIYFDTRDFELVRQSIEKPVYKEKLRLRAYGAVARESMVFVELKKKFDGVVYKRRVPMSIEEAEKYLYSGIYPQKDSQILREIDYTVKRYDLIPAALVAYDRVALYGEDETELRVTFDQAIRCRNYGLELMKGAYGTHILKKDQILMEVKIPGAMPLWMSSLFSRLAVFPVSFSKYGEYYKNYLHRELQRERGKICA